MGYRFLLHRQDQLLPPRREAWPPAGDGGTVGVVRLAISTFALQRLLVGRHAPHHRGWRQDREPHSTPTLPRMTAWPRMIAPTARYMGLRTQRYRPPTTSSCVGATGAEPGAPPARTARSRRPVPSGRGPPAAIRAPPRPAGQGSSYAVTNQGTTPATTPGATTKKSTLPQAALLILASLRTLVVTAGSSSGVPHPGHAPRCVAVARETNGYGIAPAPCDVRTRSTGHPRRRLPAVTS